MRRQTAAQHKVNGRLRGMPISDSIQIEIKDKKSKPKEKAKFSEIQKIDVLSDNEVDIKTLRKSKRLRKVVKKELKKLGLADQVSSYNSVNSDIDVKGSSASAEILSRSSKKYDSNLLKSSAESELSLSYGSSDS